MGRDYSVVGSFQFITHYHHIHQHTHKHCITHMVSSNNFWRDSLDYARLECADTAELKDATWVCTGVKVSGFQIKSSFVSILVHYQRTESYCVLMPVCPSTCVSCNNFWTTLWISLRISCHKSLRSLIFNLPKLRHVGFRSGSATIGT